jgi:hypothetical protein
MSPRSSLTSAAALLLLATAASASFASPAPFDGPDGPDGPDGTESAPATPKKKAKKDVVRLTEWPKPADKDAVLLDVERLCKARTPEMAVQAREALEAAGESTVPFLLDRMGKERDDAATKRLREVLITNTTAAHTRLLAKEFESRFATTRMFVLWRCAAFPDPEIRPAAEKAWGRIEKLGEKADPEERYATALCAASAGSIAGLEVLHVAAQKSWERRGTELRAAVEGARGPEATKVEIAKLEGADQKQKVAILRMLAGCGDASALPSIKRFLDDDDNQIRVAAINACRGIVENAPPEEQLPVFEAIEIAKKWKAKI